MVSPAKQGALAGSLSHVDSVALPEMIAAPFRRADVSSDPVS
jgi:hypothetical protein